MTPSLRVYFIEHADGRLTGYLIRAWETMFDRPTPSGYGNNREQVLHQLEVTLREALELHGDVLSRYLWAADFHTRQARIAIHPQTVVKRRYVIGKRTIPLSLTYAWAHMPGGAYRIVLPRFGWWMVLEDLETAPAVLRQAVSSNLLGEDARGIFEYRREGPETVEAWLPDFLRDRRDPIDPTEDQTDPLLNKVADELVGLSKKRRLPRPIVHSALEAAFRAHEPQFLRDPPASLLIVAGRSVGKTSWVHHLASRFADQAHDYPREIWTTTVDRLVAGMTYLGMWEKRCLDLVDALAYEGVYLHFRSLPELLVPQTGGTSVADVLTPALQADEISVIVECTELELERCERTAPSFISQFTIVRLDEPSGHELPKLMSAYLAKKRAQLEIVPAGLRRLRQLLAHFKPDVGFPGKAFQFLDWLAQVRRLGKSARSGETQQLYPSDVISAFSRQTGLPTTLLSDDDHSGTAEIASVLGQRVVGQPTACREAARILARLKAGLNDPDKPIGTLLFVGPTGVGKTELAKQLAAYMFGDQKRLLRFDMSEYHLPGSAGRLLATGRGVRSLAQQVREQPLSVVLLDELEKAHPEVFDLLLGVLGEGRLTDRKGRLVDLRMTVILMTSNLGTRASAAIGFAEGDTSAREAAQSVRQHFRPEFFNRLDAVVPFGTLSVEDIATIVDLMLSAVRDRTGLARRRIQLKIHPGAREWLATMGWHPSFGARPLKRVIEQHVVSPIAIELAGNPGLRGGAIDVLGPDDHVGSEAQVVVRLGQG